MGWASSNRWASATGALYKKILLLCAGRAEISRKSAFYVRSATQPTTRAVAYERHSGGARFADSVDASVGAGPAPGAGSDEAVLPPAKHSHVSAPACIEPLLNAMRAVGASALSGTDGTSVSVFDPAGATRVVKATVIWPVSSSTRTDSTLRVAGGEAYPPLNVLPLAAFRRRRDARTWPATNLRRRGYAPDSPDTRESHTRRSHRRSPARSSVRSA